jgi:hypothetical protein
VKKERPREDPRKKMKRLALDNEVKLMEFKGLCSNPDELASFFRDFVKDEPPSNLESKAEDMLTRGEFAFVPDGTVESVKAYKELLCEKADGQLRLYRLLKKMGVHFGGIAQVPSFLFMKLQFCHVKNIFSRYSMI